MKTDQQPEAIKADQYDLQQIDLENIERDGYSNNLPEQTTQLGYDINLLDGNPDNLPF